MRTILVCLCSLILSLSGESREMDPGSSITISELKLPLKRIIRFDPH